MFPGWGYSRYSQFSDKLRYAKCIWYQFMPKYPWDTRPQCIAEQVWNVLTHEPIVKLLSNALYKNIPKPDLWAKTCFDIPAPMLSTLASSAGLKRPRHPFLTRRYNQRFLYRTGFAVFVPRRRYQAHHMEATGFPVIDQSWTTPRCGIIQCIWPAPCMNLSLVSYSTNNGTQKHLTILLLTSYYTPYK